MENRSIIIIEDNPEDAEMTQLVLSQLNLEKQSGIINCGEKAMNYFQKIVSDDVKSTLPVLVLLDLNLPKIDGKEILSYIKTNESLKQIMVVVLTVSENDQNIIDCYKIGADNYIVKPVKKENFLEIIEKLGLYWLLNE